MVESTTKFPEVQGGGSLIVAWQAKGKHVLVVGGGEVSNEQSLVLSLGIRCIDSCKLTLPIPFIGRRRPYPPLPQCRR